MSDDPTKLVWLRSRGNLCLYWFQYGGRIPPTLTTTRSNTNRSWQRYMPRNAIADQRDGSEGAAPNLDGVELV